MDSQIPAYWGIAACVGGLGLLLGIKKIGPYYLKSLEVATGCSLRECVCNFLGFSVIIGAIVSGVAGVIFLMDGGTHLSDVEYYAEREYRDIKEKEKQDQERKQYQEQLQVLVEGQKQEGINTMFKGGGILFGVLFLAWTSVVLLNYEKTVEAVRDARANEAIRDARANSRA